MTGQTINVISASNASDADAATYTINTDPYGSTLSIHQFEDRGLTA